ncbi:MAG: DUF86 domain-containing protein [Phycisphaerae bacterium]
MFDMLDSCRFLLDLTKNEHVEKYEEDRVFRSAVERELQIIGEAMLQLKTLDPRTAATFTESDRIIGFRHVLVHGYHNLDTHLVWLVIKEKLPALRNELESALPHG